jgi:hypothetical protein
MTKTGTLFRALAVVALLPLGACDLLKVEAPGRIADEDLNSPIAFDGLVAGMQYDLAIGFDTNNQDLALFTGELWHGGSYDFGELPRGIIDPEDMNGEWQDGHQARWTAEDGLRRMQAVFEAAGTPELYESDAGVAEAYMYAGFANRMLGEALCATAIDGGGEESNTVHFERADSNFTRAIEVGGRAGAQSIVTAAYGGRATIRVSMGDWAGAVSDAQQVPASFQRIVPYTNEVANDISYETNQRFEFSVWGTQFEDHPDDPRAPWQIVFNTDGTITNGANGSTPMYQQLKYPNLGSGVPLTDGTEMLILRAEGALRTGDIAGAFALINESRAFYQLDALDVPGDIDTAWDVLHFEKGAETWMETRRIGDLRRWFEAGPSAPEYNSFFEGRETCFPISDEECRVNDNLDGAAACAGT